MWRDLILRTRSLLSRRAVEAEMDDELRFHRERQLEAYRRMGLSTEEARRRLAHDFGELERVKDAYRDARGISVFEHLLRDLRFAARSLRKTPSFSVVAVLTLALGLGATTAIFSVVYGVLLRPLPFSDPSALMVLHETNARVGSVSVSYPNFDDWRTRARSFSSMAAVSNLDLNLGAVSQPENISGEAVSANYLGMLGVRPAIGQDFGADADRPGAAAVALLSHALWQTHFAADPAVVGRSITLNGRAATIIGVLPPGFRSVNSIDVLTPLGMWRSATDVPDRGNRGDMVVVARLATGADLARAQTEMSSIAADLARAYPEDDAQFGALVQPMRDVLVGDMRPALLVLFGAVGCVLIIACANVANLCLIRGAGRAREIGLRLAIGASRGRIIAQLLVESGLLAVCGGVLGVAFAVGGLRGLALLIPDGSLGGARVTIDGTVLAFAALAVVLSTLMFGLTPALQAARADVNADLKDGTRATGGRRQQRWRAALAIAEVSLALVLLAGAGLMLRSLSQLLGVDAGVRTDHVLTVGVDLRTPKYAAANARRQFWQDLLEAVGRTPGATGAALGSNVPFTDNHSRTDIFIEGTDAPTSALPHPDVHRVSGGYTDVLGIHILQGRALTDRDTERSDRVALINRSIADRYFPAGDAVGRRFTFGKPDPSRPTAWLTIVGVAADTRLYGLDSPSRLEVYIPWRQSVRSAMTVLVSSKGDPASLVAPIRSIVKSLDTDQPIADAMTMNELRDASVSTRQVTLVLLELFSALSLTLAAIGIYGVMSYAVAQRTNELGIRLALGARRIDILKTIGGQGLAMAGTGIAIGALLSLGVARLMESLLFGVRGIDVVTLASVSAGMAIVAALACAIPGRRASRLDLLVALRRD